METLRTASFPDVANGLFEAATDEALSKVYEDLKARPGLDKPRIVKIELKFKPLKDSRVDNGVKADGDVLAGAAVTFSAEAKLPKHEFSRAMASVPKRNALGFETDTNSLKHHPDQQAIPFPDESAE